LGFIGLQNALGDYSNQLLTTATVNIMVIPSFGPLLLFAALIGLVSLIVAAFYHSRRAGLIVISLLFLVVSVNIIAIAKIRKTDPIVFSAPVSKIHWDRWWAENSDWRYEEKTDDDGIVSILHCPTKQVGITPEFNIDIADKTSFPIKKVSHLNFYLPLRWQNGRIGTWTGMTKPVIEYAPLLGRLEWTYEIVPSDPNIFVLRIHMNYSPNADKNVVTSKSVSITVQVEPE
jgi:hypothetical protein